MVRKVPGENEGNGREALNDLQPGLYLVGTVVARFKREVEGRNGQPLESVSYRIQAGPVTYEMSVVGEHEYYLVGTKVAERVAATVFTGKRGAGLRMSRERTEDGF